MRKNKTIHIISQAHLDLVWMWSWRESYSEALNNITTVVRLMEKYPQMTFSYSNTVIYQWMLASAPKLFKQVQKLVAEGRWEIVGGWLVEADCNLPSGESLLRQAFYGKAFIREHFNVDVNIGYCPDAFGHCGELPKILKESGFDYYVFSKPRYGEEFPHYFRWRASDGSEITTWRIHGGYATGPKDTAETLKMSLLNAARDNFPEHCNNSAFFLGLGDHGGGPSEEQVKMVLELDANPDLPNIKFSTLRDLFCSLEKDCSLDDIPVIENELQSHNIGCYSANGRIKKLNRETELLLQTSEIVAMFSSHLMDLQYPAEKLQSAWSNLLFNQFHDILAGTCIPSCYKEADESLGAAQHAAKEIITSKLHAMAQSVDTSLIKNNAIFVFNPLPFQREYTLAMDMFPPIDGNNGATITFVIDPDSGENIPVQFVDADCPYGPWNMPWKKLLASVSIPACGYKVFELRSEKLKSVENVTPKVIYKVAGNNLGILSLLNYSGEELLDGDGIGLIVCEDLSDTFGHNVLSFLNKPEKVTYYSKYTLESGSLRWRTRLCGKIKSSDVDLNILTYSNHNFIDLNISGHWNEKNKILKFAMSTKLKNSSVVYQTPYGALERKANGEEVVGQAWTAITGDLNGSQTTIVIFNSGIYSFDAFDNTIHLTLRRSVQSTNYGEFSRTDKEGVIYLDQGVFSEQLRIASFPGVLNKGQIEQMLAEFQYPPYSLIDTAHEGEHSLKQSFLRIEANNTTIIAIKQAEYKDSFEIRVLEHSGEGEKVTIKSEILGIDYSFIIKPFELKTLLFPKKMAH